MREDSSSVLSHPALSGDLRARAEAGLRLASLRFTVTLENSLIAPVACDIAERQLRADYGPDVVTDALRLQCDEAFHAVMAQELIVHVQSVTGARLPRLQPRFLQHVDAVAQRFSAGERPLVRFCAAVVAETLITRSLREDWQDETLQEDVRAFLQRHGRDEARHNAYFARLLQIVWPQWPLATRLALACLWDEMVAAFLERDVPVTLQVLEDAGLAASEACAVVLQTIEDCPSAVRDRSLSQHTYYALSRAGALEMPPQESGALERVA